jgi:outer membrane protein OmpA-like peptidoglycan-associated protein
MRCNWWRWLWGIIPLLVLSWVAVQAEQSRIEADLRGRAKLALAQAGMSWAATKFEGRDAILEGQAGDDAEPLRAGDLLRGVWGVRVVENRAELLPKVETFTWTARRRGNRIRIMGHVPNRATRKAILGVAKANFPGFEVVDRMETVRGVPSVDAWLGGVGFGLRQLAALKRGDVHLKDLDMWIAGEAEDVTSYRAVRSALANNLPKGIKLTNDMVTAPVVSPFTWSAQLADGRLVLAGYVPSEAAQAELLAAAKAGFGSMIIVDQMQPGDGAPKGWANAAVASVRELARLQSGSVEMKDAALVISGLAGDAAAAEAMRAALRTSLPATIKFTDQIKAKEPPPTPPPAPEPAAPAAPPPPKGAEATTPSKPETIAALPAEGKTDPPAPPLAPTPPSAVVPPPVAASPPLAPPPVAAPTQTASAADLRAKACEDKLGGLVTTGQIVFDLASAELDSASFATLDKLAEAAKACPDMRIEVSGHASSEGSAELNQQLSVRRARSVVAYLVRAGVDSTQLQPVGYGATRPIAPNDTGENMAKNRRIEFSVRPK